MQRKIRYTGRISGLQIPNFLEAKYDPAETTIAESVNMCIIKGLPAKIFSIAETRPAQKTRNKVALNALVSRMMDCGFPNRIKESVLIRELNEATALIFIADTWFRLTIRMHAF
jgi:hypothetical protein